MGDTPIDIQKRIEELIEQCKGIPPEEVMKLMLKADSTPGVNTEEKLQELFEKYKKVNSE